MSISSQRARVGVRTSYLLFLVLPISEEEVTSDQTTKVIVSGISELPRAVDTTSWLQVRAKSLKQRICCFPELSRLHYVWKVHLPVVRNKIVGLSGKSINRTSPNI